MTSERGSAGRCPRQRGHSRAICFPACRMERCLSRRRAGLPPILAPRWLVPRQAPRRAHQREEPPRSARRSQRPPGVTVEADARARCQSRQSRTRQRSNPARFRHHHLDPTRHQTARHTSPPSADPPRRLDKYALSTVPATRTPRRPRSELSQVPSRPANATRSTPSRDPRPPQAPAAARTAAQGSSRGRRGTTLCRSTARTSAAEPLSCPDRTSPEPLADPRSAGLRRFSFVADTGLVTALPLSLARQAEAEVRSPAPTKLDAIGRSWDQLSQSAESCLLPLAPSGGRGPGCRTHRTCST